MMDLRASLILGALALVGACVGQRGDPPKAEAAKVEAASVEAPAAKASPPKAEPLTQEELDLIAANPADLTPELRRKRAFALRKKIMQNPDSPTARALEETREAVERGDLVPQLPPRNGLQLEARLPGHPPSSIPDPDAPPPAPSAPAEPGEATP
ncbi:MAG: hypothetical protein H6710_19560 [Myxococcales bacterium]|nr:hypothetical protein [Myxococcales bacterium]MCB9702336.1 hypothetical protein [Myxococcales bacterium]